MINKFLIVTDLYHSDTQSSCMSHFTTYAESGGIGSEYPHYIYIYPNTEFDEYLLDGACDAAQNLCEQLMAYSNTIDFYSIRQHTETAYPYATISKNAHACYDAFKDWYEGRHDDRVGTHIVVTDAIGGGSADGGSSVSKSAFNIARCAAAGMPNGVDSEGKTTVVHEALHPIIIGDLVTGTNNLAPDDEHQLGKNWDNGDASPFSNNAENDEHSPVGDCNSSVSQSGERMECTSCEKEGVYRTSREVFN